LRAERKRHKVLQLQLGNKWPNSGLVVVDDIGAPPHPDTLSHALASAAAVLGDVVSMRGRYS
jgi:hypothetical protein